MNKDKILWRHYLCGVNEDTIDRVTMTGDSLYLKLCTSSKGKDGGVDIFMKRETRNILSGIPPTLPTELIERIMHFSSNNELAMKWILTCKKFLCPYAG